MGTKTHVWLLALGAPAGPQAAAAWLSALWSDPDAIPHRLPWLRSLLAWLVARVRAPALAQRCASLDAETLRWAEIEQQARDLGRMLGPHYAVRPVLRYAGPDAAQAAKDTRPGERVILLPLEPHVSGPTTISPIRGALRALDGTRTEVARVSGYPDAPLYVEALAETLREALVGLPEPAYEVLFCARGLPSAGGPYPAQVRATLDALLARVPLARPHHLAFTRAPGLLAGPGPTVDEVVKERGRAGLRCLVLVPLGFTSDHVETRVELDQELAALARSAGIAHIRRAPTVAVRPTFLRALQAQVHQAEDEAGWDIPWREALQTVGRK